jgi:hypothetical protein
MLFKLGRTIRITARLVKREIAISLKGLSDSSGLRCANLRMRGASVDCDIQGNNILPERFASSTYGRKTGDTAASSHGDSVGSRTRALEFLHIVWTKRETTYREKLVWMAKQESRGKIL